MIYRELPTAFVWYDDIKKQSVRQENLEYTNFYGLIAPKNAILPFQIKKQGEARPISWLLIKRCDSVEIDISYNIPQIKGLTVADGLRAYYLGGELSTDTGGVIEVLDLDPGEWYSILSFSDGQVFYSEVFKVVDDLSKYVRIEYYDDADIAPIKYIGIDFKQVVYLDTYISSSEPEIEEEGENNEVGDFVQTFNRLYINHRMEVYVPDFLKIALTSLQMHSNVLLSSPTQARDGVIDRVVVTSAVDPNVGYSTVTVLLVETSLVKNSCAAVIQVVNSNPWP